MGEGWAEGRSFGGRTFGPGGGIDDTDGARLREGRQMRIPITQLEKVFNQLRTERVPPPGKRVAIRVFPWAPLFLTEELSVDPRDFVFELETDRRTGLKHWVLVLP